MLSPTIKDSAVGGEPTIDADGTLFSNKRRYSKLSLIVQANHIPDIKSILQVGQAHD